MTTPKELADKAKEALFEVDDYIARVNGDDRGGNVYVEELRATIDQLQAMAEARQGSGEPVAYQYQGREGKWYPFMDERHYENTVAEGSWPIRALYTAPPAAQQATGSGQVLTDGFSYTASKQLVTVTKEWCRGWDACRAALAAATQAQPEVEAGKFARVPKRLTRTMQEVLNEEGWEWRDLLAAAEAITEEEYDAECSDAPAAPTPGKREPLTVWAGDVAELAVVHGIYREPDEEDVQAFAKAILAAASQSITGEQR